MPDPNATNAMPSPPRTPSTWPTWIAIAFGWTLARWPSRLQRLAGRALGRLMQATMWKRGRTARINIALCFPELSAEQQQGLLHDTFSSLGLGTFEFLRAWWGRVYKDNPAYTLKGLEYLQQAQALGHGVILVSAHFSTLEICVRLLCQHVEIHGMYRPHDASALEWAIKHARLKYTQAMYSRDELRPALRCLKKGGILWFAPDQETRRGESVFVPFFNQPAASLTSTHQLARMSDARVLPFFHRRLADGSYELEILPALKNFPSADASNDTARIMQTMEQLIRRAPEQYLWIHQRFKRTPQGKSAHY
jgi:Kdo2-lipid IVA lauroyltransferase/acyltransferase